MGYDFKLEWGWCLLKVSVKLLASWKRLQL